MGVSPTVIGRLCCIDNISHLHNLKSNRPSSIYNAALKKKARQIFYDPTNPRNDAFHKLPSGRRLKVPLAKKNLFKKSFIPSPILILNGKFECNVYFFYSIHLLY